MSWSDYTNSPEGIYERGFWDGMYRVFQVLNEFSDKFDTKEELIMYTQRYLRGERVEDV